MDITPPVTRLVMVGACYIDTILNVPHFPSEDDKLRAQSLERRRGGNVANSLEVLQQLITADHNDPTLSLHLLSVLPSSSSRDTLFIRDSYGAYGASVNTSLCIHRESHAEAACSFIVQSKDTGSRTIVNYNGLPEMELREFQDRIVASHESDGQPRTWYHFEGRIPETSLACVKWLREQYRDVWISVEVEKPGREGLEALAAEADVVFYAKGRAMSMGYQEVGDFLRSQVGRMKQASLLCCTWGSGGAAVIVPKDGAYHCEPAFTDTGREVVDTVGAGDTFIAGMLHHLLLPNRIDVKAALKFANGLAGRKVLQIGFAGLA